MGLWDFLRGSRPTPPNTSDKGRSLNQRRGSSDNPIVLFLQNPDPSLDELLRIRAILNGFIGGYPTRIQDEEQAKVILGTWKKAVHHAQQRHHEAPDDVDRLVFFADLLRMGHNFDIPNAGATCGQILEDALKRAPDHFEAHYIKGLFHVSASPPPKWEPSRWHAAGEFHLKTALRLAGTREVPDLHQALGFSCMGLEKYDEAIRHFEKYLSLVGDSPQTREILEKLRSGKRAQRVVIEGPDADPKLPGEVEERIRPVETSPAPSALGSRLHSYAKQRNDYLMYIGTPPHNPTGWSRIRHLADEDVIIEDGSVVPLSAADAFLVAYPNGQLLEVDGADELPLPPGIRGLEIRDTRPKVVRLEDLTRGEAFVKVHFGPTKQTPQRPGYYSTTLTNVGPEAVRIVKFTPCRKVKGTWTTGNPYNEDEFLEWYGMGGQIWLPPGKSAVDLNNYGDPPILWAYFGVTKSGVTFVAGAVLSRPL